MIGIMLTVGLLLKLLMTTPNHLLINIMISTSRSIVMLLYLAMSPDGSTIVTGAGDETLRFWQVFPGPRSDAKNNAGGLLFPNTLGSVIR